MLLFIEGFDAQSTSQLTTNGKWNALNGLSVETTLARFGVGQALQSAANSDYIERNIGSNLASGVIGAAFRVASGVNTKVTFFILYDGSSIQIAVRGNTDGTISIFRTNNSTTLGTSTYTFPFDTYFYLELKFLISDSISSGDVKLYADGVEILSLAAATDTKNTANAYVTKYRVGGDSGFDNSGINRRYLDDHYLLDLTGSVNNAPLGNVRVQTLAPSGNGNSSGLSGSDGNSVNNYQQVDDTTSNNGDTDYNEHATAGTKDTYAFGDTNANTGTIYGVQTNMVVRRTDTDAKTVAPVIRISSTDYDGTTTAAINSSFTTYTQLYETKPSDSTAWTKSDVDGAEFGMKVVS